jgi:threonine dehydrogenase-like Zn-dependent dehydrogenase
VTFVGARIYPRCDSERAVERGAGGQVPTRALISRVEPLAGAAAAFTALAHASGVMKVLVDCQA